MAQSAQFRECFLVGLDDEKIMASYVESCVCVIVMHISSSWVSQYHPLGHSTMSLQRFTNIMRALRFDDKSTRTERISTSGNHAAAVQGIVDLFLAKCRSSYYCGPSVTIDEQVKWYCFMGVAGFGRTFLAGKCGLKMWIVFQSREEWRHYRWRTDSQFRQSAQQSWFWNWNLDVFYVVDIHFKKVVTSLNFEKKKRWNVEPIPEPWMRLGYNVLIEIKSILNTRSSYLHTYDFEHHRLGGSPNLLYKPMR